MSEGNTDYGHCHVVSCLSLFPSNLWILVINLSNNQSIQIKKNKQIVRN